MMNKKPSIDDKDRISSFRTELDDGLLDIDRETLSELSQRRHLALKRVPKKKMPLWQFYFTWWLGPASAAVIVVLFYTIVPDTNSILLNETDDIESLDIVLSEDTEMLENLEFIEWVSLDE